MGRHIGLNWKCLPIYILGTVNTGTTEANAFASPDTISKVHSSGWSTVLMSGTPISVEHAYISSDHSLSYSSYLMNQLGTFKSGEDGIGEIGIFPVGVCPEDNL
jgi:hypothetical protein